MIATVLQWINLSILTSLAWWDVQLWKLSDNSWKSYATSKAKSTTSHLEAGSQHPWLEPSTPNHTSPWTALRSFRIISGLVFDPTLHMSLKVRCFNRHISLYTENTASAIHMKRQLDWWIWQCCISHLGTFSHSRIRCCNDHCLSASWSSGWSGSNCECTVPHGFSPGCATESMLICAPVSAAIFLMVAPAGPDMNCNIDSIVVPLDSRTTCCPECDLAYDLANQMARHNDWLVHL